MTVAIAIYGTQITDTAIVALNKNKRFIIFRIQYIHTFASMYLLHHHNFMTMNSSSAFE